MNEIIFFKKKDKYCPTVQAPVGETLEEGIADNEGASYPNLKKKNFFNLFLFYTPYMDMEYQYGMCLTSLTFLSSLSDPPSAPSGLPILDDDTLLALLK